MPLQEYIISEFKGIDQSRSENTLEPGYSPDAQNMDTESGDLAVAKGYVRHFPIAVPGAGAIRRMYVWHDGDTDKFVVVAGNAVLHYNKETGAWDVLYTYDVEITSKNWDFVESRIGNDDYLIIANGQTQMIKWDGVNTAVPFGSGEYVYEGTVASVSCNMPKAVAASYAESGTTGTYTLTMPDGWVYAENTEIAFSVASTIGSVSAVNIVIGSNTHALDFVPTWISGDTAVVKLTSATAAEVSETLYGASGVTLSAAIDTAWKSWALGVGVTIANVTRALDTISADRLTLTFKDTVADTIEIGATAKVRGGVSDLPVNYIEIYYSRLFAAGDPDHPSRLYWSQPPGDEKNIENWSADEYSEMASGGHVEVGHTNNDPIVGLTALPSQLIIHKKTGNWRLIGSEPSNFQILQINRGVEPMVNTSRISHGDIPYWLTKSGMYYFNGQQALLHPRARQIRNILKRANVDTCKGLECRDRMYFTLKLGDGEYDDSVVVFDMTEGTYMLRNGFNVVDMCAMNGVIYMINDARYVYRFNEGDSYDGADIDAYWKTPTTDWNAKSKNKQPKKLYFRGEGSIVNFVSTIDGVSQETKIEMPEDGERVRDIDLKNKGRAFSFRISNEAGSCFKILGGVEIVFDITG